MLEDWFRFMEWRSRVIVTLWIVGAALGGGGLVWLARHIRIAVDWVR